MWDTLALPINVLRRTNVKCILCVTNAVKIISLQLTKEIV